MEQLAGELWERAMIDVLPRPQTPTWSYFVSNEQVLRLGLAIGADEQFGRLEAIALGEKITEKIDALIAGVTALIAKVEDASDLRQLSPVVVNKNQKIIVSFPSFACTIDGRDYTFNMSATICQGETNSKIWVKITHFEDKAKLSENLAKEISDLVYAFYTRCAKLVNKKVKFEKKFWFDIRGAYTTDYAVTDVLQILQRAADPQAAFEMLRRNDKLSPVARLFKFASGEDIFSNDAALKERWMESNVVSETDSSTITALSVKQSDAIVLIQAHEDPPTLRAWGLCYSDSVDFDAEPPVREVATQVTGKLASLLAADL